MADSAATLAAWVRTEFAEEERSGFARLKRVPDTQVIRFLDHIASLNDADRSELISVLAEWSSYHLSADRIPHATYERFVRATSYPGRAEGLRYTGVNLLAGLAKVDAHGGLAGWFQSRGVTGLAMQPPEPLLRDVADLVPAKPATLRRLVQKVFDPLFAPTIRDIGSETWWYEGTLGPSPLRVEIRYSGRMGRPQLDYQVHFRGDNRTITSPNLCFESVLGVGFGRWDYLTKANAESSVQLLGELIAYVAALPDRLPR
jgi:hypothetical protein